jgi:hypothetical protein
MSGYIGSKVSATLVDGYNRAEADAEFVQDPNGAITVDGSNVGVGTSSPDALLTVKGQTVIGDGVVGSANLTNLTSGTPPQLIAGWSVPAITWSPNHSTEAVFTRDGSIQIDILAGANSYSNINFSDPDAEDAGRLSYDHSIDAMWFRTNGSEAMRIDSSGNVLVGKTSPSISIVGVEMRGSSGTLRATSQDAVACYFTRKGTAGGPIINFYKDATHVGVIGAGSDDDLYIGEDNVGLQFQNTGTDRIDPFDPDGNTVRDNAIDLGGSASRFDDVYVTGGLIQTSDRNEKQDIASLTPTEMLVAARLSTGFKNFRWKDAVAEKGAAARMHSGVIAQDVQDAFTAEGLDAGDYSMFISATWWTHDVDVPAVEAVAEVVDEEGVVVTEAVEAVAAYTRTETYDTLAEAPAGATERTRMGIRYPELLAFVGAYNEQRFASIETRLAALEGN